MSKSVDETVVDFFRLLLSEEDSLPEPQPTERKSAPEVHINSVTTHARVEVTAKAVVAHEALKPSEHQPQPKPQPIAKAPEGRPQKDSLNIAALEKLLAPVFEEKAATVVAEPQTKPEMKAEVTVTEPLVQTVKVDIEALPEVEIVATPVADKIQVTEAPRTIESQDSELAPQTQTGVTPPSITKDLQAELDDEFQVLFFKVAGLTLAVPLVSLGGIVKVDRINQIFGRPGWFLGVQTHRDSQLNLVDTCAWVMPEKYDEELAQSVNYQYLVLLEDSNWGLACESLVNSVRIKQSEVNWRTTAGKRPWLAGVVKEQMCGILNVQALIQMLNAGLGCQDPIN